ncbi:MAG TPA: phosphate acyltransferase PlsX [bacterium]|jgi:glycerol-3-phosphate acyltransferase PlsX|nr:phosphate acyltransferase PlsX [bacterium]
MRIALDAMTSELGVEEAVYGLFDALGAVGDLKVLAVGQPDRLRPLLDRGPAALRGRVELVPASDVIGMDEEPGVSFKAKKEASVSVAVRLVKDGLADGACSAGNTGASMTAATLILGRVPGVRRPAIFTALPSSKGYCGLLDSGAVVDCRPEDLVQFGVMGSIYMRTVMGVSNPRVGLLSIGEEDKKGNAQTLETLPLLRQADLNFIGNVEGRDLFNGACDVAVCDGFVGNVVLKTAEGISKLILTQLQEGYASQGPLAKLGGLLSKPVFRGMRSRMSPDSAGGGPLLGVGGVFIITHGRANRVMIMNSLRVAAECGRQDVPGRLKEAFRGLESAA